MSTFQFCVQPALGFMAIISLCFYSDLSAQDLLPGKVTEISFENTDIPPSLYSMVKADSTSPCMSVRLPDDYDPCDVYPLMVYIDGLDAQVGGQCGRMDIAQEILGKRGWVIASFPLFKKSLNPKEHRGGKLVGFEDYPTISKAYRVMLLRLYDMIPNINRKDSAMVGFSNGAITIAVLLSSQDKFILDNFKNFILVDHGVFHLVDLYHSSLNDCRFLLMIGDGDGYEGIGRQLVLRESQIVMEDAKIFHVDLSRLVMEDTGHEFSDKYRKIAGKWLRRESFIE
jgi:hypothetical protein